MSNYPDGDMRAWHPQSPDHHDPMEWIGDAEMDLLRATLEAAEDAALNPRLSSSARAKAEAMGKEIEQEIAWREAECANPCWEDVA